jgi:plastocyanin
MAGGAYAPVIAGMVVGVAFIIMFSFPYSINQNVAIIPKQVSIVTIPKEAHDKNFEPSTIKVVIGLNNTVRWMNEDSVPYTIVSDTDYIDPYSGWFTTEKRSEEKGGSFVMPGQFFEFTFTKPGEYGYHSVPHPQMRGTVIVLGSGARYDFGH